MAEANVGGSKFESAMGEIRAMFRSDGYDIEWERNDGEIVLTVVAGETACADCLVPKPMMMTIVSRLLEPAGVRVGDLRYPADDGHGHGH